MKFCQSDAGKFYDFLRSPAGGGLPTKQMRLLTNSQATASNIQSTVRELYGQATDKDLIVFFFSGHGVGK